MAVDVREQKRVLKEKLIGALPSGVAALEEVLATTPLPEEVEGPVGEAVEVAITAGNIEAVKFLVERFKDTGKQSHLDEEG